MAEEIKEKITENIKSMELLKTSLNSQDRAYADKYIELVNEKYIDKDISVFIPFIYKEYNEILEQSVFNISNNTFRGIYVDSFKEVMRRVYAKHMILYPKEKTIKKVGTPLKVIAQDFIRSSVATIDHVEATDIGGKNQIYNYHIMCKSCNTDKGNYPLWHWFGLNDLKKMRNNMQKYLNKIILLIKDKKLGPEYKDYPKEYAKHIKLLTKNKILLNPKLKEVD